MVGARPRLRQAVQHHRPGRAREPTNARGLGRNGMQSHQMPRARTRCSRAFSEDPERLLVVIDPRKSETAAIADIHLPAHRPPRRPAHEGDDRHHPERKKRKTAPISSATSRAGSGCARGLRRLRRERGALCVRPRRREVRVLCGLMKHAQVGGHPDLGIYMGAPSTLIRTCSTSSASHAASSACPAGTSSPASSCRSAFTPTSAIRRPGARVATNMPPAAAGSFRRAWCPRRY